MDADGRRPIAQWLASPAADLPLGEAAGAVATHPSDPLAAAAELRRRCPELEPAQAAAVLEQAHLRRLADERYGLTGDLLLTRDGLEQATRPAVAARRAGILARGGARRVLDLTGGLGLDAIAFCDAGLTVTVLERDPVTAVLLAHNCTAAQVIQADATEPTLLATLLADLGPDDVVFVDPARRDPAGPRDATSGRARPERDPGRWSPPWPFVLGIPHGRIVAKVAPGFSPPADWHAEWTSVDRTLVECTVYSWAAFGAPRRAVLLTRGMLTVLDADPSALPLAISARPAAWLHEPDPAVVRAGAVSALAALDPDITLFDEDSSWLTSDLPSASPTLRSLHIIDELTGSPRQKRRQLADFGVRRATVKSRDVDVQPRGALRELGLAEGPEHVLVLTRRAGRVVTLLTEPATARSD
ncbi:MAG: class I SAM-dependent methyltransferase [Actinobacteria bacterium]|nr:class I SAM-dependent methyltransferase [Actinomycetota bacterium]